MIDEEIGLWTRDKNARQLMDDLQKVGVPAGVVQNQADLWEDPQVAHRGSSSGWTTLSAALCRTMA